MPPLPTRGCFSPGCSGKGPHFQGSITCERVMLEQERVEKPPTCSSGFINFDLINRKVFFMDMH